MESFLNRGRKAIDSLIGKDVPPDEILEKCKTHLNMLVKSIDHMEQKYEKYASTIIDMADAGRLLGNNVVNFYKKKESRQSAANAFNDVQSELQSMALSVFQEEFHEYESVASGFSEWRREVNALRENIKQLEQLRLSAHRRKERIKELQSGGRSMFGSAGGDLSSEKAKYQSEVEQYKQARGEVKSKTGETLTSRFAKFDMIFVRFMELQLSYFSQSSKLCAHLNAHVGTYRRKNPKKRPSTLGGLGQSGVMDHLAAEECSSSDESDSEEEEEQSTQKRKPTPVQAKVQNSNDLLDFSTSSQASAKTPVKRQPPKQQPAPVDDDVFGLNTTPQRKPQRSPVEPSPPSASQSDDIFGLFDSAPTSANVTFTPPNSTNPKTSTGSVHSNFDDFFSPAQDPSSPLSSMFGSLGSNPSAGSSKPWASASAGKPSSSPASHEKKVAPKSGFDPMGSDFWTTKQTASQAQSRKPGEGRVFKDDLPDDPVLRQKIIEAQDKKLAELHALQQKEKIASDIRKRAEKQVESQADQWEYSSPGVRKNIRALLASIQDMLNYPECTWKPVLLHNLLTDKQVKKTYRKAMTVCHPDMTGGLAPNKRAKAERVFRALNEALKS